MDPSGLGRHRATGQRSEAIPPADSFLCPRLVQTPNEPVGETQTFVVSGGAFVSSDVPDGGSISPSRDGIVLETMATSTDALSVNYQLDPELLPVGRTIIKFDAQICGEGQGQSWEVSGPVGSTPTDYASAPPDADGCWHFSGVPASDAPTNDMAVTASTTLESQLYIERVVYAVTFGQ